MIMRDFTFNCSNIKINSQTGKSDSCVISKLLWSFQDYYYYLSYMIWT